MHPFRNFLADLPPPTLYKVETRKKFWIHASNIVCGVRGVVLDLCELENAPKGKSVPRFLSMIVVYLGGRRNNQVIIDKQFFHKNFHPLKKQYFCHYSNRKFFCYCIVPPPKWALLQLEKFCLSFSIIVLQPSLT